MPYKTLPEIESEINRIAILLGANEPKDSKGQTWWDNVPVCGETQAPGYRGTRDASVARIRVGNDGYHLIMRERGSEYPPEVVHDFETLLYLSFKEFIHSKAYDYATHHHFEQNWYRRLFNREVDLYARISPALAVRHITARMPGLEPILYDDNETARAQHYRELLTQGQSREDAWATAEAQFPPIQLSQPFPPAD